MELLENALLNRRNLRTPRINVDVKHFENENGAFNCKPWNHDNHVTRAWACVLRVKPPAWWGQGLIWPFLGCPVPLFQDSSRAKPFIWKWVWFIWRWTSFAGIASHEDSFWHRGKRLLGIEKPTTSIFFVTFISNFFLQGLLQSLLLLFPSKTQVPITGGICNSGNRGNKSSFRRSERILQQSRMQHVAIGEQVKKSFQVWKY